MCATLAYKLLQAAVGNWRRRRLAARIGGIHVTTLRSTSLVHRLGRSFRMVLGILLVLTISPPYGTMEALSVQDTSSGTNHRSSLMFIENVGQFSPCALRDARREETLWLAEDAIWITVIGRQVDKEQVDKTRGADCDAFLASLPTCLPTSTCGLNLKLTFPALTLTRGWNLSTAWTRRSATSPPATRPAGGRTCRCGAACAM